jgi:hypothetical protein
MTAHAHAVVRRLRYLAAAHCPTITIDLARQRPWASALFVGERLTIAVSGDDDARLDAWLIALPDMEMVLRRRFVASAEVIERRAHAATVDVLVVED